MTDIDEPEVPAEGSAADPAAGSPDTPAAWPAYWMRMGPLGFWTTAGTLRVPGHLVARNRGTELKRLLGVS